MLNITNFIKHLRHEEPPRIHLFFVYLFLILSLEYILKLLIFSHFWSLDLLFTLISSIPIAAFCTLLTDLLPLKAGKVIFWCLSAITTFLFLFQFIFFRLFSVPFSFASIGLADQALDFFDIAITTIGANILGVVAILLPLAILIILHKFISFHRAIASKLVIVDNQPAVTHQKSAVKYYLTFLAVLIASIAINFASLLPTKNTIGSPYELYYNTDDPISITHTFGLLTGMRLDIQRLIFGFEETLIIASNSEPLPIPEDPVYQPQTTIDFEALSATETDSKLKSLADFFATDTPSYENEYSGLFAGKNLIFIIGEAFNDLAVDKKLTPTLYKLSREGFIFSNFYSPVFFSTTGGEYQALTSLLPNQNVINQWKTKKPQFPYAIGYSFARAGYRTQAYHDWTYTYYSRNQVLPTAGFSNFTGCGNGLEKLMNCKSWPSSDIDFIEVVSSNFIGQNSPQATYLLTVSGHANYNFGGQNIARKNRDLVKDLPYSEGPRAYMAAQIELDRALKILLTKLEDADELDNTVIALVGDHYPYALSLSEINEFSAYQRDAIIEVNHSNFILWSSEIKKPIKIDKVGSQIDVLPTLLNLFSIPYDSRLLMGRDILDPTTEGLAIFSNRSWVTDSGTYFSSSKTFVPKDDATIPDNYTSTINQKVANKFSLSASIFDYNYYSHIVK